MEWVSAENGSCYRTSWKIETEEESMGTVEVTFVMESSYEIRLTLCQEQTVWSVSIPAEVELRQGEKIRTDGILMFRDQIRIRWTDGIVKKGEYGDGD